MKSIFKYRNQIISEYKSLLKLGFYILGIELINSGIIDTFKSMDIIWIDGIYMVWSILFSRQKFAICQT
jgi:hypothetical protein